MWLTGNRYDFYLRTLSHLITENLLVILHHKEDDKSSLFTATMTTSRYSQNSEELTMESSIISYHLEYWNRQTNIYVHCWKKGINDIWIYIGNLYSCILFSKISLLDKFCIKIFDPYHFKLQVTWPSWWSTSFLTGSTALYHSNSYILNHIINISVSCL